LLLDARNRQLARCAHFVYTLAQKLKFKTTDCFMRAEIQTVVDEIEQAMSLLRRHL
jgi:hypothetical protein